MASRNQFCGLTVSDRFFDGFVITSDDCWNWIKSRLRPGYGEFYDGNKVVRAHRWAYEQMVGPIPDGLVLDHLCRNPGCVNPEHLEVVTHRTNILRGFGRGARQARQTHCRHGHPLSGPNLYVRRCGRRACRVCVAAGLARWYRRHHAA